MKLTIIVRRGEEMLIGRVREVPGVVTQRTTVPRHPRLDRSLCEAICKQLGVDKFEWFVFVFQRYFLNNAIFLNCLAIIQLAVNEARNVIVNLKSA